MSHHGNCSILAQFLYSGDMGT